MYTCPRHLEASHVHVENTHLCTCVFGTCAHVRAHCVRVVCVCARAPARVQGATEQRVVPGKDGGFKEAAYMRVTLSCDHRTVDGAVGASFLQTLKSYLSNPTSMLL